MPKQEKYKLQRLLEMRERTRDEAAVYLVECRNQLSREENELEKRKQAVEHCRLNQKDINKQMLEKSLSGIKSSEYFKYRRHLADLRDQETHLSELVEEQKTVIKRAEQTVETALEALGEAAKEVKVIEKHRENWQNVKRLANKRLEQKTNDEIGTILHNRQNFE